MNRAWIAAPAALLALAASPTVSVTDPWARASAPGQETSVVYLSLLSPGGDTLLGADAAGADMAMLHQTVSGGGLSGMTDAPRVDLPAAKTVRLAPGGLHLMLMGLAHPLRAGERVAVTLHFAKAGDVAVSVPVRPLGASGP